MKTFVYSSQGRRRLYRTLCDVEDGPALSGRNRCRGAASAVGRVAEDCVEG